MLDSCGDLCAMRTLAIMDNLFFYYKELRSLQLGVKSDRSEMELIIEHNGAMQLF